MEFGAISWLGAILGAVAFFAFGALWYGPLFGKQWMAATGVTEDATIGSGIVTGLLVSLLIAVPVLMVQSLYERKQPVLFALNAGYNVVGFVIMGAMIGALQ